MVRKLSIFKKSLRRLKIFLTHVVVFLNGPFPASFSLFSSFQYTVDSKQNVQYINNFCQ